MPGCPQQEAVLLTRSRVGNLAARLKWLPNPHLNQLSASVPSQLQLNNEDKSKKCKNSGKHADQCLSDPPALPFMICQYCLSLSGTDGLKEDCWGRDRSQWACHSSGKGSLLGALWNETLIPTPAISQSLFWDGVSMELTFIFCSLLSESW